MCCCTQTREKQSNTLARAKRVNTLLPLLTFDLRSNWSPHITALSGEVQCLDACLSVALEAEDVDDVQELGREEGDSQVEQAVAEAYGGHQPLDRAGRNGIDSTTARGGRAGKKENELEPLSEKLCAL